MASFVLSFFPLDVLDGIWDLIESVSEGFLTYFYTKNFLKFKYHDLDLKATGIGRGEKLSVNIN